MRQQNQQFKRLLNVQMGNEISSMGSDPALERGESHRRFSY